MLNARFSAVNRRLSAIIHIRCMSDVWSRVFDEVSKRPGAKGREETWLAEKLNCSVQRVHNWAGKRGVPVSAYAEIADALGWTVDAVAGRASAPGDPWPFESITRAEFEALSERQKGMLELRMREALGELLGGASTPKAANGH